MDIKHFHTTLSDALRKRNFAYTMCGLLSVSNVLLCYVLSQKQDHWVLYPWPGQTGNPGFEFNGYDFSDDYLRDFADRLSTRLLTMNPQTVDSRLHEFMFFTNYSGTLLKKLESQAKKIKSDHISTVFYPKEFFINREAQTIEVMGDFYTYFGADKAPVISSRTVTLTWDKGKNGIFILKDFDLSGEN